MKDKDKHLLAVAIECNLYDILSEISKSDKENKESLRKELIENFIDSYKSSFPNVTEQEFKEYIDFVLKRTKSSLENSTKDESEDER